MRTKTTTLLSLAALFALSAAHAAPPARGGVDPSGDPRGPRGAALKKVRAPGFAAARLAQTVQKNGQTLTRQQVLEKFEADASLDLANGTKISAQELLDRVEASEAEVTKKGSSLTSLKKSGWLRANTALKLTNQRALVATEQKETEGRKISINAVAGNSIFSCTPQTCVPKEKEKTVKWDKTKGDEDTIAVYTSFAVTEQTPNASDTKCTATWDNGVHLMGSKQSLIKLTAEAAGTKGAHPSASGKAALYVLGQASPVWSKEGKISDNLDRTFKTPRVSLNVPFIPLVSVEGGIQAAATLSLRPAVSGDADAKSAGCSVTMTPRVTAEVDPDAKIVVGIKKLVEIAEGGVRAQITVLDVALPTTLGVKLTEQPTAMTLLFKSEVKSSFLKGKVVAWYKIKDICAWGFCLIEDGLGIDTSGEIALWQDDVGFQFNHTFVDFNGNVALGSPNQMGGGLLRAQ